MLFGKVSLYKNILGAPGKNDQRYSDLPIAPSVTAEASNGIEATTHGFITRGSSTGSLLYVPYDVHQKNLTKSWQAASGSITDFQISPGDPRHIAAAGDDGRIQVFADNDEYSISSAVTAFRPTSKPLLLSYHPHAQGLLASLSADSLSLYNLSSPSTSLYDTAPIAGKSSLYSVSWANDGKTISCSSRDGMVRTFDPRRPSTPTLEIQAHDGINKPTRITYLDSNNLFSTGFGKSRSRELCLWDIRNPSSPSKKETLDQNTSSIIPVADQSRGIIYLAGRGDVTLRWVEPLADPKNMTLSALPIIIPISGVCMAHPSILDIMHTEISKLLILSTSSKLVSPTVFSVPRRQYVDFHSELYPPINDEKYLISASDWKNGSDTNRPEFIISPQKPGPLPNKDTATTSSPQSVKNIDSASQAVANHTPSTKSTTNLDVAATNTHAVVDTISSETGPFATSASVDSKNTSVLPNTQGTTPDKRNYVQPTAASSKPASRWLRKYITGKKPYKPIYEGLGEISNMLSAHVHPVKANASYLFLALPGPAGRIGFHELSKKGRLPLHFDVFLTGTDIIDFDLDPFDDRRIFVAGKDGAIRVFYVPENLERSSNNEREAVSVEPKAVLTDKRTGRIQNILSNPVAKDIFLVTSEDVDTHSLRVWDASTEKTLYTHDMPSGVVTCAWEPNGYRVASITKDRRVLILNPISLSSNMISSPSHNSPRIATLTWLNSSYLLTSGFTSASTREIILYSVGESEIEEVARTDIHGSSPAPLFPTFDFDTQVLYLWAKGEHSIHCYDVNLDNLNGKTRLSSKSSVLEPLPSFETSNIQVSVCFLPKWDLDIKNVEIAKALRICQKDIEFVCFTIPRAKTDFFQDDIFVPTIDHKASAMSSSEWASGKEYSPRYISLQPDNMIPLSQATSQTSKPKTNQQGMVRTGVIKTESQKQDDYLDNLFQKAKLGGKESGDEEDSGDDRKQVAPDDDDW